MKKIILILVLFVSIQSLMADNGDNSSKKTSNNSKSAISGKIIDIVSGESLAGACLTIEGTDIKVYSDLDGNFTISNIEPGNYSMNVSMISYKSKESVKISLNPGAILDKNIVLEVAN